MSAQTEEHSMGQSTKSKILISYGRGRTDFSGLCVNNSACFDVNIDGCFSSDHIIICTIFGAKCG